MKTSKKKMINWTNCDDKEKKIEEVKEKLRWYTFEASEDEFDVEEIDALVEFLKEAEPELGMEPAGDGGSLMVQKASVVKETQSLHMDETQRYESLQKMKEFSGNMRKRDVSRQWTIIATTVVVIIIFIMLNWSIETVEAWESGNFFNWLKRDQEGQTMITLPENLNMDNGNVEHYYDEMSDVPEKYQKYLMKADEIDELKEYQIESIKIYDSPAFIMISTIYNTMNERRIELGVVMYAKEKNILRDNYDKYLLKDSKSMGEYQQDIYAKKTYTGKVEYIISCFDKNNEYYVVSQLELEKIETILEKYLQYMLNQKIIKNKK